MNSKYRSGAGATRETSPLYAALDGPSKKIARAPTPRHAKALHHATALRGAAVREPRRTRSAPCGPLLARTGHAHNPRQPPKRPHTAMCSHTRHNGPLRVLGMRFGSSRQLPGTSSPPWCPRTPRASPIRPGTPSEWRSAPRETAMQAARPQSAPAASLGLSPVPASRASPPEGRGAPPQPVLRGSRTSRLVSVFFLFILHSFPASTATSRSAHRLQSARRKARASSPRRTSAGLRTVPTRQLGTRPRTRHSRVKVRTRNSELPPAWPCQRCPCTACSGSP